MRFRKIAITISLILFVGSIGSIFMKGLSLGLDFSGGTLVEIQYEESVNLQEIRNILNENGYEDFQVVNFGSSLDVLIKIADQPGNSSLGDQIFAPTSCSHLCCHLYCLTSSEKTLVMKGSTEQS